jgi:hypothetical protein
LVGIKLNRKRGRDAGITHASTQAAYTGTDRLKGKDHPVRSTVATAQEDIGLKLKGLIEVDEVGVPDRARLTVESRSEGIAVGAIGCGTAVGLKLGKRRNRNGNEQGEQKVTSIMEEAGFVSS